MVKKIFNDYITFRKELQIHTKRYYFKKTFVPFVFSLIIYFIFSYSPLDINHKDIAVTLVSTNSLVAAFLILSLTMLLTQEINGKIPNLKLDYKKFLVNNAEISVVLIFFSILINLFYMLISNPLDCDNKQEFNLYYLCFMDILGFVALFSTILVIKLAIWDLLLISKNIKD